jgi:multiple sugar transport system permease protein
MLKRGKGNFFTYILLTIGIFFVLIPVAYMILIALTPHGLLFVESIIPARLTLQNFVEVLRSEYMMSCYRNSWIISSLTTLITLILASLAGYGFSRFKFKLCGALITIILLTQMLPMEVLALSYFNIIKWANLYNTWIVLVFLNTTISLPFSILMMKSIFDRIPRAIEDAARIDGCSTFSSFTRIVLPLSWAGLSAAATFAFLMSWAEYLYALTFTSTPKAKPVTVAIADLIGHYITTWEKMMALAVLTAMPILILFGVFQGVFIRGLTAGAIKE